MLGELQKTTCIENLFTEPFGTFKQFILAKIIKVRGDVFVLRFKKRVIKDPHLQMNNKTRW